MAFGQHNGISGIPPISIGPFALVESRQIYFLIWAIVVQFFRLLQPARLPHRTRHARAPRRQYAGRKPRHQRIPDQAGDVVIAAFLGALSGWLYAHLGRFVSPGPFVPAWASNI